MFQWCDRKRFPLIVAHRGSSQEAPENTLAAFQQAMDDGADAIEMDLRITRDHQIVVFHDRTLERTTDGKGKVEEKTLVELKLLSAGSWFHRKFLSERIPTLSEVFQLLKRRVGINLEIKSPSRVCKDYGIVERCYQVIKEYNVGSLVLISSFHLPFLIKLKKLQPNVLTGLLYHPVKSLGRSPVKLAKDLRVDFLILSGSMVRKRVVENAHEEHILVGEYTVDTYQRFERSIIFGIDAVFTNVPARMIKFFEKHKIRKLYK